jgi:hypothetical protein
MDETMGLVSRARRFSSTRRFTASGKRALSDAELDQRPRFFRRVDGHRCLPGSIFRVHGSVALTT